MEVVLVLLLAAAAAVASLWLLFAVGDPRENVLRIVRDQHARGDIDTERYVALRSAIENATA